MTKQTIIERTVGAINRLPQEGAEELLDFVTLLLKRYEERTLSRGIQQLSSNAEALDFLKDEDDSYTLADLKKVYHG